MPRRLGAFLNDPSQTVPGRLHGQPQQRYPRKEGRCGLPVASRFFNHHELVAVRVRQRPQQELIDNGEDRGIAADAESQRQDYGKRKAWAAPETTSGVSDVSRDIFRKAHRPLVVAALLEPRQIAELPPRGALCVDVAQSVTSVVARQRVDMEKEKGRVSLSATRP
jgi:hypothetical protein